MSFNCKTLDEFLSLYGDVLARKARTQLAPLHVPGRDKADVAKVKRKPFDAQAHVVAACVKAWKRQKAVQLVAEMGSGKTFMAMTAIQSHAEQTGDQSYRQEILAPDDKEVTHWVDFDFAREVLHEHLPKLGQGSARGHRKVQVFPYDGSLFCVWDGWAQGSPGLTDEYWGTWRGAEVSPLKGWAHEHEPLEIVVQGSKDYGVVRHVKFGLAVPRSYRTLVVCPGQLVEKWAREIRETIPSAKVTIIGDYSELLPLAEKSRDYRRVVGRMKAFNRRVKAARAEVRSMKRPAREYGSHLDSVEGYCRLRPEDGRPKGEAKDLADNQLFERGDGQDRRGAIYEFGRSNSNPERRLLPWRPEFYVIGRDRLKLSSTWAPAYRRRAVTVYDSDGDPAGRRWKVAGERTNDERCTRCPRCGRVLINKDGELLEQVYFKRARRNCDWVQQPLDAVMDGKLTRTFSTVKGCGERLWQEIPKPRRYSPAKLIQKKLRGYFDYLVVDEAHEYKGTDSIQADAIGAVASACDKVIALTGTLVGGYAWHIRTLLFRIGAGRTMVGDGFGWKDEKAWNDAYGRMETKIIEKADDAYAKGHKYAKGEQDAKKISYVRPGIMPTTFKHLIGNSVFLALDEVAANLPPLLEDVVEVGLDPEQATHYKFVEKALTDAIKEMARKGNKKMLGTMLNCLLAYPDFPYGWGEIGYRDKEGDWIGVVTPQNLDPDVLRPKEQALVERVLQERNEGRQVWVYCQYTDKRDCIARVRDALEAQGLKVKVMRAAVSPADRESWINENGYDADVIVSHPDLVKTGLDFFNRAAGHNYATIMFYQCGYNLFTLRQAARRAWRIGQRRECRVLYFYYTATMQERAMTLMGRKLSAANALEGKFSSEGLAAMAGDDENMEMALAKSLADGIKEEAATRAWAKLTTALGGGGDRFAQAADPRSVEEFLASFNAEMAALGVVV